MNASYRSDKEHDHCAAASEMVPGNFSWMLMKVAFMIKASPSLDCHGLPKTVLWEACAQLERYLFIDGQPTSMFIRGGELRRVPQGCALSVHFCDLASWAWNVCMKMELPHVRTNAYLDNRLLCAGSCDPLPGALEITKQVDDLFWCCA